MKIIQVIGLPGSGKTTGINKFLLETNKKDIQYFDIKYINESLPKGGDSFFKLNKNIIFESACGYNWLPSFVILLSIPTLQLYENLKTRDKSFDPDYLSLLGGQMITPDCKINSVLELTNTLHDCLNKA